MGQVLALQQQLAAKVVHGEYFKTVTNSPADKRLSALWLTRGVLQIKTEAFIVSMQDGVTKLLAYKRKIPLVEFAEMELKLWGTSLPCVKTACCFAEL